MDTNSGAPYFFNTQTQKTQWEEPPSGSLVYVDEWGNAPYVVKSEFPKPAHTPDPNLPQPGVKRQGPTGANLFVFHLPNDWSTFHEKVQLQLMIFCLIRGS